MDLAFLCNISKEPSKSTREYKGSFHNSPRSCKEGCGERLQSFAISVAMMMGHARFWNKETLCYIMIAATIMHNMIMEHQQDEEEDGCYDYDQDRGKVLWGGGVPIA
jgi:hypothetical protein